MRVGKAFFIGQLILAIIILWSVAVRTVAPRLSRRMFAPKSAAGGQTVTQLDVADLTAFSVEEYPAIVEQDVFVGSDSSHRTAKPFWSDNAAGQVRSDEDKPASILSDVVWNSLAACRLTTQELESDLPNLYWPDEMVANSSVVSMEENPVIRLHKEQGTLKYSPSRSKNSCNPAQTDQDRNVDNTNKTRKSYSPVKQALVKIRTDIRCVETMLKKAIIEPYHVNGRTEGLRLTGLERIRVARDLGLKSGDVIRAVNGQPLCSVRRAYEIFKRARKQPIMSVELLRDGETKALLLDFR